MIINLVLNKNIPSLSKIIYIKKVTCVPVLQQSSHFVRTADTLVSQRLSNSFIQFGTREIISKWYIVAVSCSFYLSPSAICSFWCTPTHFLSYKSSCKAPSKKLNTCWRETAWSRFLCYRSTINNGNLPSAFFPIKEDSLLNFQLGEKKAKQSSYIL